MGGRHFKKWLEIEGKKCTEGQMDLLQVLSLPSLCGIRIAKPHAANPKWKFFCKSSDKVPCFAGRDGCTVSGLGAGLSLGCTNA